VVQFVDRRLIEGREIEVVGADLNRLIDELGHRKLLLNFSTVEFQSSAMLGKLASLNARLRHLGGKLVLCGIRPEILEAYTITRLDTILTIVSTEQAGLKSF
jgi:anti-sigma B factor antagonist